MKYKDRLNDKQMRLGFMSKIHTKAHNLLFTY